MLLLRFLPRFLSFTSPVTSHLIPRLLQAIGRERVHAAGVPKSTNYFFRIEKIFGWVWVQTEAACVTGECFIHCPKPLGLGQTTSFIISVDTVVDVRCATRSNVICSDGRTPSLIFSRKKNNDSFSSFRPNLAPDSASWSTKCCDASRGPYYKIYLVQ